MHSCGRYLSKESGRVSSAFFIRKEVLKRMASELINIERRI